MATIVTTQKDVKLGNTKAGNVNNTQVNFTNLFDNDDALNDDIQTREPKFDKNTAFNKNFFTGSPNMDGTASAGDSTDATVAKGTHRHPTDTSRLAAAPDGTTPLLDSNNKIASSYLPDEIFGQLDYQGTFNAASPAAITTLKKGYYYICSTAGSKNPDGTTASVAYAVGDWAVYNGTSWDKVDNTDAVTMVNGQIASVYTYKGVYTALGYYWYGDTVSYNDVLYLCIDSQAAGTIQPAPGTNSNVWMAYGITAVATTTSNGLMSSTDKSKLDGIEEGANKTVVDSALSATSTNPVQNKAIYNALEGIQTSTTTITYFDASAWNTVYYVDGVQYAAMRVASNVLDTSAFVSKVYKEVPGGSTSSQSSTFRTEVEFDTFISSGVLYLLTDINTTYGGWYYLVQHNN